MREIKNEFEFEQKIRHLIKTKILPEIDNLILFESKKAVDIILCKNGSNPKVHFIEVKYHKENHGRLGFGSKSGIGFQPEILRLKPDYFLENMIWILGVESSESYWVLKNNEIVNFLSKGTVGIKYNNIQKRLFKDIEGINEESMIEYLMQFLK